MEEVCKKCQGQKTYRGIGCVIIKCQECNGKGQVTIKLDVTHDEITQEEKPKRKLEKRKQEPVEA